MTGPTRGRIVLVRLRDHEGPRMYKGSDVHPAIVTSVHGPGLYPLINVRVFTDSADAPLWETSLPHHLDDAGYQGSVWMWPREMTGDMAVAMGDGA